MALAQKVVQRVTRAGFPVDLIPTDITSITVTSEMDAENSLRTAVLEFIDSVRAVEKAIAAERRVDDVAAELHPLAAGAITGEEWRACWASAHGAELADDDADADSDVESDDVP